jgi:heterodisulfide reductase subunit A-like polyferredoxin
LKMDLGKSIDDKFSKLHPCWPVGTRIGIVGAGPSGLTAAYALPKLGYRNVAVFEKCHTVSGMCESVDIEGEEPNKCTLIHFSCSPFIYFSVILLFRKDI